MQILARPIFGYNVLIINVDSKNMVLSGKYRVLYLQILSKFRWNLPVSVVFKN